jgi:hypothetical protein
VHRASTIQRITILDLPGKRDDERRRRWVEWRREGCRRPDRPPQAPRRVLRPFRFIPNPEKEHQGCRGTENSRRYRGKPIFLCISGCSLSLCIPTVFQDFVFGIRSGLAKEKRRIDAGYCWRDGPWAITRQGLPVKSWIWPGNTADVSTIEQVKRDLAGWRLNRVVYVADGAMMSQENLTHLARGGSGYIVGVPLRTSKEAAAVLARPGRFGTVAENLEVKEVTYPPPEEERVAELGMAGDGGDPPRAWTPEEGGVLRRRPPGDCRTGPPPSHASGHGSQFLPIPAATARLAWTA